MVAVFHSRTENMEAVNFKKGIAAAFQANFRGTTEEVEVDPTSKHFSHYKLVAPISMFQCMSRLIEAFSHYCITWHHFLQ